METLREANEACNRISETAFQTGVFGQFALHHEVYKQIRATTRLSSQMAIRCIAKVADSYKAGKRKRGKRKVQGKDKDTHSDLQKPHKELRTFKSKGAIPYDSRILNCHVSEKRVSIWTVQGRRQIPFSMGPLQEELLGYPMGESDLVFRKGKWYLNISSGIPDVAVKEASDVLGVDLGIRNIAATSEGELFSGDDTIRVAGWYQTRRKRLQQAGTRSAKRRLRKLAKQERNHKRDVNHRISKKLVTDAERSGRAIAIKWSFDELKQFIRYKAEARGVRVILEIPVTPRSAVASVFM
jgi:transposase